MDDFLGVELCSPGAQLVTDVVRRLKLSEETLPDAYIRFLANVAKETPVAGLLQKTKKEPLLILMSFARETVDLSSIGNLKELKVLKKEIPPFWDMLQNILKFEKSRFLPKDVARIVMQLITIRNRTFSEGVKRSTTDYTEWDESRDHPTAYYPDFPPRIYPQRYSIKNQADPDRCQKEVNESKIFIEGLMTVGCSCRQNITLGFELMLQPENPRNIFRFLMCRFDIFLLFVFTTFPLQTFEPESCR